MTNKDYLYTELSSFYGKVFPFKVQKISINAGFTCPNRDGSKGFGGCTYCNNQTFNPSYCATQKSVTLQIEEGKTFFARKYPEMKYLAYFQAYTGTYGELRHLISLYEEALKADDVVGLVIGTRPDCMPDELLDYLADLSQRTFLTVEYGIESANDDTLRRINRGHTYAQSVEAIERTAKRGIYVGAHVILGLPGEDDAELIRQARLVNQLPITTLKLHQLQLIKGTVMAREYEQSPFRLFSAEEYIDAVISYISHIRRDVVLERFVSSSPKDLLLAPNWNIKNYEFVEMLKKKMRELGVEQGCEV
ncbi:MAG: TIGR01212 family radical SAM protein [Bacteroidaceae bacterium]|nr:TIGR01212 family radical SAM protein [Bacteroidaceae bacterium]MBQ4462232.1 TIGR01212 family radical SAM protein [Bacteroidaceae bacterium]MBQ7484918.1 TIGR01212 family radical SAM protein [Bacteroidaceae bacterium]